MTGLLIRLFVRGDDNSSKEVRSAYGNLAGFTGIGCNLVLFAIKLVAGLLSGSISIMADAFNNLSDMGSSVVTLLGFKIAGKPADKEHPFGHGRMEYMSGFMVAVVIILVGFELLKGSADKIMHPAAVTLSVLTVAILLVSVCVKLWMYFFFRKIGRSIDSSAIFTTARDSLNDVISTAAVLISAIIAQFVELPMLDGIIGACVAVFIMFGGYSAAKEMLSPLMGEPPSAELVNSIREGVMSYDGFIGIHDLVVHSYGPGRIYASLHVEVRADSDVVEVHETVDRCEHEIGQRLSIELVLHMDPIVTDDEHLNETRDGIVKLVKSIDESLHIHDFRMVDGVNRTNLIFDVVVPYSVKYSQCELRELIGSGAKKIDGRYVCVINFDNEYV